jgi:hypothetical protein
MKVMPAERRKSKRTKMVLPVKVTIDGVVHLAHTFDLTHNGARLGGIHVPLKQGQVISVQRGPKKGNFKIMWVQELSPKEFQAGIQAMETHNNFWGVDLSEQNQHASGEHVMAMMAPKK